jgi:hypothetical protein
MLDAATKALSQILSPPMRAICGSRSASLWC